MKKKSFLIPVLAAALLLFAGCTSSPPSNPPEGGTQGGNEIEAPNENPGENPGENPNENPGENPGEEDKEMATVTQIKRAASGRTYIDYRGTPYTLIGAQIRADGMTNRNSQDDQTIAPLSYAEIGRYIKAAADFGVNTVEIPVEWRDIEPQKDVYDFTSLDAYMAACNEHGIKMEMLWFSTNMCGDSYSNQIPEYIVQDTVTYPRLASNWVGNSWMYGDRVNIRLDSPALLEREYKACKAITDHIFGWNKENGEKYPVIGIQVHNEADGLARWRADDSQAKLASLNSMTKKELWQMILRALDNAGKGFKAGAYKVYTRVNLTVTGRDGSNTGDFMQSGMEGCSPKDVLALEGIDIVGDDPYTTSSAQMITCVQEYAKLENNYPHIAENMGDYSNSASLMLAAVMAGGGYCLYDLATPQYFVYVVEKTNPVRETPIDQGILTHNQNGELVGKAHSEAVSRVAAALRNCSVPLATLATSCMASFGIPQNDKSATLVYNEVKEVGAASVRFETSEGACGFAFTDGKSLTLFSLGKATFTVDGLAKVGFEGYYEGSSFVRGTKIYSIGGRLSLDNQLIQIAFAE